MRLIPYEGIPTNLTVNPILKRLSLFIVMYMIQYLTDFPERDPTRTRKRPSLLYNCNVRLINFLIRCGFEKLVSLIDVQLMTTHTGGLTVLSIQLLNPLFLQSNCMSSTKETVLAQTSNL